MSNFPKPKPHRSSRRQPRSHLPSVSLGDIDPGTVRNPQVPRRGINLEQITSDNYVYGYDGTSTPEYIIKGDPGWWRPGGNGSNEDLRVRIGYTPSPLLCDFKGGLTFANNSPTSANFHVRVCAVLYTGNFSSGHVYQRAETTNTIYMPANNNTYPINLITSFIVPASFEATDSSTGDAADWYVGFQIQAADGANHSGFQVNRQSIACTFYAAPLIGSDDNAQDANDSTFTFDAPFPRTVIDLNLS